MPQRGLVEIQPLPTTEQEQRRHDLSIDDHVSALRDREIGNHADRRLPVLL
jgi:hypothetical protein